MAPPIGPAAAQRRACQQLVQRTSLSNTPSLAPLLSTSSTTFSSPSTPLSPETARRRRWAGPAASAAPFSTTACLGKRRVRFRDNNPNRGVSALYRSGPREPVSMSQVPLPKPRKVDVAKLAAERTDPDHGLWEFFYDKRPSNTPAESAEHGRPWTVEELRAKSWDDLHKLWWVCCKERNRIATAHNMRSILKMGFGNSEGATRDEVVRKTMKHIKHTLTERWYAWEDAVKLAQQDPEINFTAGEGAAYTPRDYMSEAEGTAAVAGAPKTTAKDIHPASIPATGRRKGGEAKP